MIPSSMKLILICLWLFLGFASATVLGSRASASSSCRPLEAEKHSTTGVPTTSCFSYSFYSKSLARSIDANVYLPKGYSEKAPRLPYAIFLHGRGGDRNQSREIGMTSSLDRLVNGGGRSFLVVAPSGGESYWMNGAITKQKWGDMVARDLVADTETRFHVIKEKADARALFGLSMGGAGTLQIGFTYPSVFSTAVSMSPIFRRESEIWAPHTQRDEPKVDYGSFGQGADYFARSPRHLCVKNRRPDGSCLPFKNFRLDMGENDDLMAKYSDTRKFILDLKEWHPQFAIAIGRCKNPIALKCSSPAECYGHTFAYWSCSLPSELQFISERFDQALVREPAAGSSKKSTGL
jgi:S-formylglutathione hydrolase FrmB